MNSSGRLIYPYKESFRPNPSHGQISDSVEHIREPMNKKPPAYPLTLLEKKVLSAVDFVSDYFQLEFDGPYLTVLSNTTIIVNSQNYDQYSPEYCNLLVKCIGHFVKKVSISEGKAIKILFSNNTIINISLKPEDYVCPEAAIFTDNELKIWNFW